MVKKLVTIDVEDKELKKRETVGESVSVRYLFQLFIFIVCSYCEFGSKNLNGSIQYAISFVFISLNTLAF